MLRACSTRAAHAGQPSKWLSTEEEATPSSTSEISSSVTGGGNLQSMGLSPFHDILGAALTSRRSLSPVPTHIASHCDYVTKCRMRQFVTRGRQPVLPTPEASSSTRDHRGASREYDRAPPSRRGRPSNTGEIWRRSHLASCAAQDSSAPGVDPVCRAATHTRAPRAPGISSRRPDRDRTLEGPAAPDLASGEEAPGRVAPARDDEGPAGWLNR